MGARALFPSSRSLNQTQPVELWKQRWRLLSHPQQEGENSEVAEFSPRDDFQPCFQMLPQTLDLQTCPRCKWQLFFYHLNIELFFCVAVFIPLCRSRSGSVPLPPAHCCFVAVWSSTRPGSCGQVSGSRDVAVVSPPSTSPSSWLRAPATEPPAHVCMRGPCVCEWRCVLQRLVDLHEKPLRRLAHKCVQEAAASCRLVFNSALLVENVCEAQSKMLILPSSPSFNKGL